MNCLKDRADLCGVVLDTLPLPIFVVNADMQIVGGNPAAAAYLDTTDTAIFHRRSGEVMNCIHSARGCGRGAGCGDCVVRQVVRSACQGKRIIRQKASLKLRQNGKEQEVQFWVTATPFPQQGEDWTLVVFEDVTELLRLRGLLPICAQCKKVRDSEQDRHEVSTFLHANMQLDFTHGLCPECLEATLREIPAQEV